MFKSNAQRRFLEAITHNADFARKAHVNPTAVKPFVADAEQMPQPTVEKVAKPKKPKKFGALIDKLGSGNA